MATFTDDDELYGIHRLLSDVRFVPRPSLKPELLRSAGVDPIDGRTSRAPVLLLLALVGLTVVLGLVLFLLWWKVVHLQR